MDLFEAAMVDNPTVEAHAPLAVRMRPRVLDEVVGHERLLQPGSPLRRLIQPPTAQVAASSTPSVIMWGPPGTGKTTLAYLVARESGRRFVELSAVSAGVKDIRAVVDDSRRHLVTHGEETVLFVDEVHRFSRSQQDALLPSVENRWVTLIAATTENPSFCVVSPLLSRSLLLTLEPLTDEHIAQVLRRALADERGLGGGFSLDDDVEAALIRMSGSDARKSLTLLESAAATAAEARGPHAVRALQERASQEDPSTASAQEGEPDAVPAGVAVEPIAITLEDVEQAADSAAVVYDRGGDQHYDVASAFIKSMRGSDPDATLHYLARMIVAGEDPRFIARRIVIQASEDVGLADPSVLVTANAAMQAVAMVGMPEAQLILAHAALAVATAPKSNAVTVGIHEAIADVRKGNSGRVPAHLRDSHYAGAKQLGHGTEYKYAHNYPHGIAPQQYLPDELEGRIYYRPTGHGFEERLTQRMRQVREILKSE